LVLIVIIPLLPVSAGIFLKNFGVFMAIHNPVTSYGVNSSGDSEAWLVTDGAAHVAETVPSAQESQYEVQVFGAIAAPITVAASGSESSSYVYMGDLSELRSLWMVVTDDGVFTVTATPSVDASGTVEGSPIPLVTGVTADEVIDLPLSLLPYTPYAKFTFTETGTTDDVDIYAFLMGRGGA